MSGGGCALGTAFLCVFGRGGSRDGAGGENTPSSLGKTEGACRAPPEVLVPKPGSPRCDSSPPMTSCPGATHFDLLAFLFQAHVGRSAQQRRGGGYRGQTPGL